MKPKTIKRKPSWPKWARWYSVDHDGGIYLYQVKPVICLPRMIWQFSNPYRFWMKVGVRKPYRTTAWRNSLRRIVP